MATVETVTGRIDADQLGTTLVHEHLIYRDEAVALWWPHVGSVVPVEPPRACGAGEQAYVCPGATRRRVPKSVLPPRRSTQGQIAGIQHPWPATDENPGMGWRRGLLAGLAGSHRRVPSEPGGTTCHLMRSWC